MVCNFGGSACGEIGGDEVLLLARLSWCKICTGCVAIAMGLDLIMWAFRGPCCGNTIESNLSRAAIDVAHVCPVNTHN